MQRIISLIKNVPQAMHKDQHITIEDMYIEELGQYFDPVHSLIHNLERFSAGTHWALVLSNLVMRSDFVQIEAVKQHLKIEEIQR